MAVNRFRPHLLVLPEDDATRSLAIGFSDMSVGQMQVLPPVRGWSHVLESFEQDYISYLSKYQDGHMVLLIDFDDDYPNRLADFQARIPATVADRVYVLGALTEAETLTRTIGKKLGPVGSLLAKECKEGAEVIWNIPQLQHNAAERARLAAQVQPFLF
jgi:hypothetical protein